MSAKQIRIIYNPTTAKLLGDDKVIKQLISEALSYKVSGAEHMAIANWDGVSSMFDYRKQTFPAGLVRYVRRKLERLGHKVIVQGKTAPEPQGPVNPTVDNFPFDPRYDYQLETVERLIKLKRMIAQVATGGGKSRIFKLATERLGVPTLFITTRKSLMYQMANNYAESLNKKIGVIGDGHWAPNPEGVTFAIVDSLIERLDKPDVRKMLEDGVSRWDEKIEEKTAEICAKKKIPYDTSAFKAVPPQIRDAINQVRRAVRKANPLDEEALEREVKRKAKERMKKREQLLALLEQVQFLTLEEAHEVGSDSFFRIAQACVNAHYRLALTATPFMRDDEEANMRLMAATGPIGMRVSEKLLIDRGILATPYFKFIRVPRAPGIARGTGWQAAYKRGIVEHDFRNQQIVQHALKARSYGLSCMTLVTQEKHGKTLEKLMRHKGLKARFIFGKDSQDRRQEALDQLRNGDIDVLIGSTIMDVGIDVPSVGMVILAGGGKAEVAIRQRIGRGLREKKSGPNVAFIVEFKDEGNNHLVKHSRERRRIIEDTPGFVENIVKDFDFEALGFQHAA